MRELAERERQRMIKIVKGYAETSIGQIHYRRVGRGKNLLLLHKTPTCSEMYEPLMRLLSDSFNVVAVDSPGFGMSDWLPRPFTIPDVAKVILEFLDALQIRRTSIFGHYTGASTACEIASSVPRRVEKLILSGPVNYDAETRRQRLANFPVTTITEDGSYLTQIWNGLVTSRLAPPGMNLDMEQKMRALVWRLKAEPHVINFPRAVFGYDMASRLPKIQAPTLVIAGEHDQFVDRIEATANAIKGARHYVVPGATGWIDYQKPEELARIIRGFMLSSQV